MTEDFNKWWDSDGLVEDNPYTRDTPVYWAWEGWQAGVEAEREACAGISEADAVGDDPACCTNTGYRIAAAIRARGQS